MKTNIATTQEQTQRLLRCGVSADTASMSNATMQAAVDARGIVRIPRQPLFTLADILSLLPKSIEYGGYAEAKLNIYTRPHRRECWVAKYIVSAKTIPYDGAGEELIDALYEVLLWAIDHNHVKLD